MSTFSRDRNDTSRPDVIIMSLGDTLPVQAGPGLRASGWRGGLFVRYVQATDTDLFVVEQSDGNQGVGFLVNASENYDVGGGGSNRNYSSFQLRGGPVAAASGASTITIISGGPNVLFAVFETVALNGGGARAGGPITYVVGDTLKISENGLVCNDPDVNLAAAGIANPLVLGFCFAIPSEQSGDRLGMDMKF